MKIFFRYFALLFYSCLFFILMLFIAGFCIAGFYYFKNGWFNFPLPQIKRAIVFGSIAGAAVTLAAIVFNLIDKFTMRKKNLDSE